MLISVRGIITYLFKEKYLEEKGYKDVNVSNEAAAGGVS